MSDAPERLGVALTPVGVEAALFSANASAAWLCLFGASGENELARHPLAGGDDGVFRGSIPDVRAGARYGFRCDGPYDPASGHRFDPSKLLADPYGLALDRPYALHPSMFERHADSGPFAPKNLVIAEPPAATPFAGVPWARTILYELNLRGFTRLNPDIPEASRGRFAGLAHPAAIGHLKALGVTSVEIMPADACVDERHLPPLGLANAWGYNPVVMGVPDPLLAPGGWAEVRAATDALHEAGLEAILDVVLNHNGESDEFGPTLSFRGLDNAAYFRLNPGDPRRYVNDMGCGNCLALDRAPVVDMALAALRRWMAFGGIDGFRFDLATAMGRREHGFDARAPLLRRIAQDPLLAKAKLIAEPWDIGPGGYQLGRFPEGWGEWNDKFRDGARRFWRGDAGMLGELATRLSGSSDVFGGAPAPSKSVNFVAAHDGFTLADLVAYERKHNEANGEGNRDGSDDNHSWNDGAEGPSDDPAIVAARARDQRNLLATLMVARGAPMLGMGAELGHGQRGNNNAYAQDNATSWIDWGRADQALLRFTRRSIALRARLPALAADAWLTGRPGADGLADVAWRDAEGPLAEAWQWQRAEARTLVAVLASDAARVAVAFNAGGGDVALALPAPRDAMAWRLALDTSDDEAPQRLVDEGEAPILKARSTALYEEVDAPQRRAALRKPDSATLDGLAKAAGISAQWWDVAGNHTLVSPATKMALLAALRLPAGTCGDARDSMNRLVEDTGARRLPQCLALRAGAPLLAPLRGGGEAADLRLETERGETRAWRAPEGEARKISLADGREIGERMVALPDLPEGRHTLWSGDMPCALTIAPEKAFVAEGARRKRFGHSAQLYAQRRAGDQGIGDFTTLAQLAEAGAKAGAATLGVNPLHALFPSDRARVSPYQPSDRRFLDAIHIDALDDGGLPIDDLLRSEIAACAPALDAARRGDAVDYDAVWSAKRPLLQARFAAFARARAARPQDPLIAEHDAFAREGGEALRRFGIFQGLEQAGPGASWREWPTSLRDAEAAALQAAAREHGQEIAFAVFLQWLADRQLKRAAARAQAAGLELGFYRDLAVGAAPDGAEAWARAGELAQGLTIGAPPDPFSAQGQIWNLPAPDPFACARGGWRDLSAIFAANMRHAGLLRIDHAMGLTRLFLVPEGGKPAEGTYLAYPLDDLVGQIALESQRARCMVVGEDLGTVPDGFRQTLADAEILGTRVLWFERAGMDFLAPQTYPALSVACATTHDLATLAGWWSGADIAERLGLGLLGLEAAPAEILHRLAEKRALAQALRNAGRLAAEPDFVAPLSDAFAAAIYAFVGDASSQLALAQLDDLAGESVATNLPGTDKERPNWRHRLGAEVEAIMSGGRAKAIGAALAGGRA